MTSAREIIATSGIGASEIAAVLDISPYSDPWRVFARHRGLIEPDPPTDWMRWGLKLQRPIAEMFTEDTGIPHEWYDKPFTHPERPYQRATVDALIPTVAKPEAVLEIKTADLSKSGDWGKTYGEMGDEDGVPDYYLVQVQWQMSAYGLPEAYVAVLIAGNDFRVYKVRTNPELEDILLTAGEAFWRRHIMTGVEPPIGASEEARRWLSRRFPREREKLRPAEPGEFELLNEYALVRQKLGPLVERKDELESQLKLAVGEAEGIESPFCKFSWKIRKGRQETNWKGLAESQLVGYSDDIRHGMIAEYTRTGDSVRAIRFTDKRREADE